MLIHRRREDGTRSKRNANEMSSNPTKDLGSPGSSQISSFWGCGRKLTIGSCLIFSILFTYFCVQVAFEAQQIWGIPIGHERAVEINKVLHIPGMLRRSVNWFGQSQMAMMAMRQLGGEKSRQTWEKAKKYMEDQREIVLNNAAEWELHRSLEAMEKEVYSGMTFYDIIATRAKVFEANLDAHGWSDFRLEKDKCEMYTFIKNNGFPYCEVLGEYNSIQDWRSSGKEVRKNFCAGQRCFAKMCHITMGHLNSAVHIRPERPWSYYVEWAENLWYKRPIDWDRTWGPTFDKLTATLTPRAMIQTGFSGGRNKGKDSPIEVKVEVVWGHAYLAYVSMGIHDCGNPIILRDGTVAIYNFENYLVEKPDQCHKESIVDKGKMDVVWHMAEAFAKATTFDSIRIDIFIPENGDPREAVINEISLSSGAGYAWHWEFFTKLWVDGYKARKLRRSIGKVPPVANFQESVEKIARGKEWYAKEYSKCNPKFISDAMLKEFC
mmetsp:Transcript_35920/g.50301  ORF Transcript_35920/g.50301 Transcript_35920/m.50301 type:complete len:493 (+) Transcript_35920:75-1553(+)